MSARGPRASLGLRALPLHRPRRGSGLVVSVLGVAAATVAIYGLKQVAPVLSLDVVYLPVVLLVAVYWGAPLGLGCALLSSAAFNFFHLPPTGRFTIAEGRSWVSLAAFVVVALVVAGVAELARARALDAERRRAEADLAAAMARELLLGEDTGRALGSTARRVAQAYGLSSAALALAAAGEPPAGDERRLALTLHGSDGEPIGSLLVPRAIDPETESRLRGHAVPTLEALVAIARRRDALQAQRVQTEALRRSDDIKTALLRAVSHDLRTPLTSILAAGHALGSTTLEDRERAELSESVVSEAARLSALVDKLLDLSRLQAGAARPRADWISVEELVTDAALALSGEPLAYALAIDPDVPEIHVDPVQLERALANLLENARRHGEPTPQSPVHVHVRRSGERVLIAVVDHGPGIEPAEQARIFEPFYRGPRRSGRDGQRTAGVGSGLGLAIVRGFVEANGGSVSVQSLPGQGTSFTISLPVGRARPEPTAARQAVG